MNYGAGRPHLSFEQLESLPVPLPSVAEQDAIVNALIVQLETIQAQVDAIDRGFRLASAQRQNILRAAFSGQLVPQDPADEPASVLLARIREQRAATQAGPQRRKPRVAREPE